MRFIIKMENTKILHIIDSLGLGGAQTVVKGVFEMQQKNKNIFLCALRKRKINIKIKHKNIKIFDSNKKYSFKSLFELKNLIKKEKIDVLHCHLIKSQLFGWFLKIFYFPKIKLIQHEHGEIFLNNFLYNKFLNISQKTTDLFIAVSKVTKNKLIKNGKVKNDRITVLYNFVDLKKFLNKLTKEKIFEERKKLGIKKDEFVVGYVGRLSKTKECDVLIKSLACLKFNFRCLIVGNGSEKENLKRMVNKLGIENKIIFTGYINKPEKIYPLFDAFVMPSLSESFGISAIEASSQGVPVIVSNIEVMQEIIENNKNGLLFEVGDSIDLSDKLNKVYNNGNLRMELSKNGLENVKRFSLEGYIEKLNKIYN